MNIQFRRVRVLSCVFIAILLASCTSTPTTQEEKEVPKETTKEVEKVESLPLETKPANYTQCYRNVSHYANEKEAKDIEELLLKFDKDGKATGEYNLLPAFRNQRKGRIEGFKIASRVEGKYIFEQDGKMDTAKVKVVMRENEAIVIVDPPELGLTMIVEKVDCN